MFGIRPLHRHVCGDCGAEWWDSNPSCSEATGNLCDSCESARQYDFFHAQEQARIDQQQQIERENPRLEF